MYLPVSAVYAASHKIDLSRDPAAKKHIFGADTSAKLILIHPVSGSVHLIPWIHVCRLQNSFLRTLEEAEVKTGPKYARRAGKIAAYAEFMPQAGHGMHFWIDGTSSSLFLADPGYLATNMSSFTGSVGLKARLNSHPGESHFTKVLQLASLLSDEIRLL